jgi:hypothetical protein
VSLPVDEAKLMYGLNSQRDLGHIEARNVLCEDLVLDEHSHQVTTGQKLHEHVEEGVVLESGVQLHNPGAVRLGKNITLSADVSELVFLELMKVNIICRRRGEEESLPSHS